MRRTAIPAPHPQTRLQRALTLFVLVATVLMALGTVVVAVYIYQPDLDFLSFFRPLGAEEGATQGTPLGELLAERVPLGTPGAGQESIGGPTIEPGSAIQLTIEPLEEGEALSPLPSGEPTGVLQPTVEGPAPEATQAALPTDAVQPTQAAQPTVEPTSLPLVTPESTPTVQPTQPPPSAEQAEVEIGFLDVEKSSDRTQLTVSVMVSNVGSETYTLAGEDISLNPVGGGPLTLLASEPELPQLIAAGSSLPIKLTFPLSNTGSFELKVLGEVLDIFLMD